MCVCVCARAPRKFIGVLLIYKTTCKNKFPYTSSYLQKVKKKLSL